jgi:hypothetical protein
MLRHSAITPTLSASRVHPLNEWIRAPRFPTSWSPRT